jgi:hypothetical protein
MLMGLFRMRAFCGYDQGRTRLSHAAAHLPCGHDPGHGSEDEDETRAPLSAHDADSTQNQCDDAERERDTGRAVKSQRLLVSWISGFHKRDADQRLGSGDGERKTLLTRRIAFEPLPASVLLLALLVMEQVENFSAYLRWIGVPAFVPVLVDLPTSAGKLMSVPSTPLANLGMGVAEPSIRAEVGSSHHATTGQL